MRRLWLLVACALVAVVVVLVPVLDGPRPSDGESHGVASPMPSVGIERPLRLPQVDEGGDCPLSLAIGAGLLPGRPSAEAALGPGLGPPDNLRRLRAGPAYVMLPAIPRVAIGLPTAADRRLGEQWGSSEALVLTRGSYRGPLLLRGDRVDGAGTLAFGPGTSPSERLELPAGSWDGQDGQRRLLRRWGVEQRPDARWRAWVTTLRFEMAGCYGIQVDGRDFGYPLVFAVGRTG